MDPSQFYLRKPSSKLREARRDVLLTRQATMPRQADDEQTRLSNTVGNSNGRTKRLTTRRSSSCSPTRVERRQYDQVRGELEVVKRELSKLKLGMASILEEKARAQTTLLQDMRLKTQSHSTSAKEASLRHEESSEFSFSMEETNKEKDQLKQEKLIHPDKSNDLEHELAVTLADVSLLQKELKLAKEDSSSDSSKQVEDNFELVLVEGLEASQMLASVTQELEAAKKELASVREEGFQFTSSMDIIKNELKRVTEEIGRLKKADVKAKGLNTKLVRAKSKLEAASAAEAKTKATLTNLSLTLEQLQTEAHVSKKEKSLISEETEAIKAEIQNTESEITASEEKLLSAMQALEDVKSSEALALEKLKSLIETSMRVFSCLKNPTVTISKFEHEYLTGHAVEAEELADKKVAAAQAWIEAFKASEKEVLLKIEIAQRDLREIRIEEEREVGRTQRCRSATRREERESRNLGQKQEENNDEEQNPYSNFSRKYVRHRGKSSPYGRRQAKLHKSASSPSLQSTPVIIKKNRKVMHKLGNIFGGKRTGKDV